MPQPNEPTNLPNPPEQIEARVAEIVRLCHEKGIADEIMQRMVAQIRQLGAEGGL